MNKLYKVGVLIPMFNKEKYIEQTLDSIVKNYLPKNICVEIIVVDDYSKDNSVNVVNAFVSKSKLNKNFKINLISLTDNLGPSGALNIALKNFDGDFIAPMDADDLYTPNSLFCRIQHLLNNQNIEWVTGNELTMTTQGNLIVGIEYLKELFWNSAEEYLTLTLEGKSFIPAQSSVVRLSTLEKIGFSWKPELRATQDVWFNLYLLSKGINPFKVDEYVAIYRVPDTSGKNSLFTRASKNGQFYKDFLLIAELLKDKITSHQYDLILKIAEKFG